MALSNPAHSLELTRTNTLLQSSDAVFLDKLPNAIRTFLFDRYWKTPFEDIKAAVQAEVAKTKLLLNRERELLPDSEIRTLQRFVDIVAQHHDNWLAYKKDRKPRLAREVVVEYKTALQEFHKYRVTSNRTVETNARQEPVKRFVDKHTDKTIAFHRPTRPKPAFDPWWQIPAMERSTTWFKTGHLTKRIHWLRGEAGFGKTALLWRITDICLSSKATTRPWVASISFDGGFTLERFINDFIITILIQFVARRQDLRDALHRNCENLKLEIHDGRELRAMAEVPMNEQIEELFLPSIRESLTRGIVPRMVIILDGVDKCEDGALHELWAFIERITSPDLAYLPFYFILSGSNVKKVRNGLDRLPLRERVDTNDVQDHRAVRAQAMEDQRREELLAALVKDLQEHDPFEDVESARNEGVGSEGDEET